MAGSTRERERAGRILTEYVEGRPVLYFTPTCDGCGREERVKISRKDISPVYAAKVLRLRGWDVGQKLKCPQCQGARRTAPPKPGPPPPNVVVAPKAPAPPRLQPAPGPLYEAMARAIAKAEARAAPPAPTTPEDPLHYALSLDQVEKKNLSAVLATCRKMAIEPARYFELKRRALALFQQDKGSRLVARALGPPVYETLTKSWHDGAKRAGLVIAHPQGTLNRKTKDQPMTSQPNAQPIAHVHPASGAAPAPTLDAANRRRIRDALDEHYDEDRGRYRQAWGDKALGAKLNLPWAWVKELRTAMGLGPDENEQALARNAEVDAVRRELAALGDEFLRRHSALEARLKKLEVDAAYRAG